MQTYPIILGTAGHIDHGKTSLVKALTGIDTDRLKVEKERGITTELGFAHLDLKGRRFGLVDVPGHERFIKAMVAGAGGLDLVCLVIAADEGIMPQTREHLDICELLGVRLGVIALSKSDLVDAEWLELMQAELREALAGSFLADAPIVPISSHTGAGLETLKNTLIELTEGLPTRSADGRFRLPVDRVFTVKGFGTVVTGTIISGATAVGDELSLSPSGKSAKLRGLQVHGAELTRARAGMRCAMNLAGVGVDEVRRGDIVTHQGSLHTSHIIDVSFRYLGSSKSALKKRSRVLLHHGASQRMAALVLVNREELHPGEECLAQLRLEQSEALAALPDDHFILRGFEVQKHYGTTLGGGRIIRVQAPKAKPAAKEAAAVLDAMSKADQVEKLALEIKSAHSAGRDTEELAKRTGWSAADLGSALQKLVEANTVLRSGKGKLAIYLHSEEVVFLERDSISQVETFHTNFPEKRGMPKAELSSRLPKALPPRLFDEIIGLLLDKGALEEDEEVLRKPGEGAKNQQGLSPAEDTVLKAYKGWGNTPERTKEVAKALGLNASETQKGIQRLLTLGLLVKVSAELNLHAEAIATLGTELRAHFESEVELSPGQWKEIVGASRKFTIPLAEYFDREKFTLRVGNIRKLRG